MTSGDKVVLQVKAATGKDAHLDGGSGRKALGRLIPNLNNALAKPAADEFG